MFRSIKAAGVGYAICALLAVVAKRAFFSAETSSNPLAAGLASRQNPASRPLTEGAKWFVLSREGCTSADLEHRLAATPPPKSTDGLFFTAACFAVAGKTEKARELIDGLPPSDRATGILVLETALPSDLDAGDEGVAAMMELVLDYAPEDSEALVRAGLAEIASGENALGRKHLTRFLEQHPEPSERSRRAQQVLGAVPSSGR